MTFAVARVAVEKAGEDEKTPMETELTRTRYEQLVKERDAAQRAYTHARQEVEVLLNSLSDMKADRDQAIANYQNIIRAPAALAPPSTGGVTAGSVTDLHHSPSYQANT